MAQAIVIIGGLGDDTDRAALLDSLRRRSGQGVEWDWFKADENIAYHVPKNQFNRLLARLRDKGDPGEKPRVVKLNLLHGRDAAGLFACSVPVLAPKQIGCKEELIEWLFSAEANLIPRREWYANLQEATLVAILTKLIKNKSWNKDTQGHQWTKEEDLLGQAPVNRREFTELAREAASMLPALKSGLLLCKGGKQGKTPREWSIRLSALTSVKQSVIEQSLAPLLALPQLNPIVERARGDQERPYRLDDDVVTERVRQICRDRRA